MRRTYISPEFDNTRVFGTYNMKEESALFASKMLEIEDSLILDNQNLIYYQNESNEQLDISIESSLPSIAYSTSNDKKSNHKLEIDKSQTDLQKESNTKYLLTIDLKTILSNYIFSILKQYRTFEGVKNNMTKNNDINFSIKEYVTKNVIDRYKFDKVELYIKYNDLRVDNILRFDNTWDDLINKPEYEKCYI